jgi:hypothetical protein
MFASATRGGDLGKDDFAEATLQQVKEGNGRGFGDTSQEV